MFEYRHRSGITGRQSYVQRQRERYRYKGTLKQQKHSMYKPQKANARKILANHAAAANL